MVVPVFDGLCNFREVEGVRRGVLYRSEEMSRLSAADGERMRGLGIRMICDLRSEQERQKRPARLGADSGIRMLHVALQDDAAQREIRNRLLGCLYGRGSWERYREITHGYYQEIAFARAGRIGEVMRLLAREENQPAVIHCTAGRDRTGVVAALVQLAAGVAYERVVQEYLRTNECFAPRTETFVRVVRVLTLFQHPKERLREMASAHREYLDGVHAGIVGRYGSVGAYLREACGVGEEEMGALRG